MDESGSMTPCYDQVIDCVNKIVDNRRKRAVVKDKISLIKFDDEAELEILNQSVLDEFKVSPMRGGGTTFVKPLEKLIDVLREIDFDIEIPVVLFLSDGMGESIDIVLDFINENIIQHPDLELNTDGKTVLFFTIGFGNQADAKTLEAMAKAFNRGYILFFRKQKKGLYKAHYYYLYIIKIFFKKFNSLSPNLNL